MISLTWPELFFRAIPEGFFVILAIHAFSKKRIDVIRYIVSSLLFSVVVFGVRRLPISYGIPSIISLIVLIGIVAWIDRINITKTIRSAMIAQILLFVCEGFNLLVMQYILHLDLQEAFGDVRLKLLLGLPSLFLLIVISVLSYYLLVIRKKEK